MTDLFCTDYSEKAFVVRGKETKTYKEELKQLGGKFNALLKGGPGWIFSKTNKDKVNSFISSCSSDKNKPSDSEEDNDRDNNLLGTVRDYIAKLEMKDRMKFVSDVARICLELPIPLQKVSQPVTKIQKKKESKQEEITEDGSDIEEEVEIPVKRLLC